MSERSERPATPTCEANAPKPHDLPRIRTPQMIADYATALELAREAEVRARDDCAKKMFDAWKGKSGG
jgi:hypothetical protein